MNDVNDEKYIADTVMYNINLVINCNANFNLDQIMHMNTDANIRIRIILKLIYM